jgi:hypothetical protein
MWVTKQECLTPSRFETLYAHTSNATNPGTFYRGDGAGIIMTMGCETETGRDGGSSTIAGDFLRIVVKDDSGLQASFDWSLNAVGSGDFLSDTWMHLVVSVGSNSVRLFADGVEAGALDIGFPSGWRGGDANFENPAYPQPWALTRALGPSNPCLIHV